MELHRSLADDEPIDLTQDESPDGLQENVDFVGENQVCFKVFIDDDRNTYVCFSFLENPEIKSTL